MPKLFSIISLILMLVLFPPATLAVISNNAVPGDATYSIKRGLEDIIYAVASLNPNTKAMFAKARSDRRFQEIAILTTQGKEAHTTLNELVEQTQIAASQIEKVSDPVQKTKLIAQLSESIQKYDTGLSRISSSQVQPAPAMIVSASISPRPTPTVTAQPTTPKSPIPQSSPSPIATPAVIVHPPANDIDQTRAELEKIKQNLEKQSQGQNVNKANEGENKKDQQNKQDKEKKENNDSSKKDKKN